MFVDTSRRLQSVYVPVGDGVQLVVRPRTGELSEREIKDYARRA
jgi:hypothetical protein